jgi:DNA-nicking Smr family endonuclease
VARKKKKKRGAEVEAKPELGGDVKTSLRSLLGQVEIAKPEAQKARAKQAPKAQPPKPPPRQVEPSRGKPSETLRGDDRIAFYDAFAGVRPLAAKTEAKRAASHRAVPTGPSPHDREARARLGALVAGGVRFEIDKSEDRVSAIRAGANPALLRELARKGAVPEATLDLHGWRADEAEVIRFVRAQARKGSRRVCIVHGKGLHSEGGVGVLRDCVVRALIETGAAPVVRAFVTAPAEHGGGGALIVALE